jgi:pyrimidine-nucleoside phosphorylase
MNFLPLLEAKRDGQSLTAAELREIVAACTAGQIADYQLAAFLMAIYFRGLTPQETAALTLALRDSGEVLVFPPDSRPLTDKHSTGGVGDKVSLPLAPLLACLGFRVPMISGRGLGITGGTLDKFDSIPGFKTSLPKERIVEVVQEIGCVVCGQTDRLVPADKALYGLRDVTGTVPSLPLIVASILSKKLAEGLGALVLDVKFGAAAFMPTPEKARELAQAMVSLGNECGVNTRALVTRMDAPLGRAAGNWLEVKEAVACLDPEQTCRPASPAPPPADVLELVRACAAHLLVQTGKARNLDEADRAVSDCLASGAPRRKWDEMLVAQGGDLDAFNRKLALDHAASRVHELKASQAGYVSRCDARLIGLAVRELGGGRLTKDSVLDYDAGVDQLAKPGEMVGRGSVYARIHAPDLAKGEQARAAVVSAFELSAQPPVPVPLINEVVT